MGEKDAVFGTAAEIGLSLSTDARAELVALGFSDDGKSRSTRVVGIDRESERGSVVKRAISAHEVLNEAYEYALPSSFSRGMRVELPGATMLFFSGTASVDENGATVYPRDFGAQCLRTYRNLTLLLAAEGASWHDIVRTTCYLRDIDRDYDEFNRVRTMFMKGIGLDPLPASTGIEARLCRADLLIEIEAIAILRQERC